eukprot:NODE_30572_length_415_cov_1.031250.p3 GENE.NODE_30572_length_415_cov_1.031250~~NODE_30572_length_415_cov_1.031250.p3  ORF type:complete len:51 (-),score=6.15 NODE_30572_length_415_cov_1.031250:7-159(-)
MAGAQPAWPSGGVPLARAKLALRSVPASAQLVRAVVRANDDADVVSQSRL